MKGKVQRGDMYYLSLTITTTILGVVLIAASIIEGWQLIIVEHIQSWEGLWIICISVYTQKNIETVNMMGQSFQISATLLRKDFAMDPAVLWKGGERLGVVE